MTTPPMAAPRVAAGVLYRDSQDRVLLVKPTYKDGWDIPGGYVEPGESPRAAAEREVVEELGVRLPVGRLLVVDWAPHPDEGDKLLFVFDGERINRAQIDAFELGADEIERASIHEISAIPELTPPRLARRIALAHSVALGQVEGIYIENGAIITPGD